MLIIYTNRNKFSYQCICNINIFTNLFLSHNYLIAIMLFIQYILFNNKSFFNHYNYYILLSLYILYIVFFNYIFYLHQNNMKNNYKVIMCLEITPIWFFRNLKHISKTKLVILIFISLFLFIVFSIYVYMH